MNKDLTLELRHCKKGKRETLQVVRKHLDSCSFYSYKNWATGVGRDKKDIENYRERCTKIIWYCPCCGKHWESIEEHKVYDREFKV